MSNPSSYLTNYTPQVEIDLDQVVTLDFETFWDSKDFSLKKMSMEAYIRDPRFLVHGLGIKVGDKPTKYIPYHENVAAFLARAPLDRCVVVGHNAHFDMLILSEIYNVRPKAVICTQAMGAMVYGNNLAKTSLAYMTSRWLPGQVKDQGILFETDGKRTLTEVEQEQMGVYCKGDVDKTWALFKKFLPDLDQSPMNLDTIDLVTRMFTDPMLLLKDDVLADLVASEAVEKQLAVDACIADDISQLRSNPKMATLLESLGVEVPMKISHTTGKETYAFAKDDRGFIALTTHDDPRVRDLVNARLRCKTSINETRAKNYLEVANRGTWPVHLIPSGARTTHRLSGGAGGGGNPQNLGKKSPLRAAVVPPPGFKLFAIDSSNIEMRGQMALANDRPVVELLRDPDVDMYSRFASTVYACELDEVDDVRRNVGKVAMLSLGFGSGAPKFHHTAWTWGVPLKAEEAATIVTKYRATFPKIPKAWDVCARIGNMMARGEEETTWFDDLAVAVVNGPAGHPGIKLGETGLFITYPNLKWELVDTGNEDEQRRRLRYDVFDNKTWKLTRTDLYGAKLFQHIIQSLCRNVVMAQSLAVDRFLRKEIHHTCRTVMHVHDESIHLIPDFVDEQEALDGALEIYATAPPFWPDLPTFGEAAFGDSYATAKP